MSKTLAAMAGLGLIVIMGFAAAFALRPSAQPSGLIQAVALPPTSSPVGASNAAANKSFQIQPGRSSATFTVGEVLRGSQNTVVGTTNQVSGQIAIDLTQPTDARLGTILVDARALATDDSQRNRILNNVILSTNQYEYVSFVPTSISGLPADVTYGSTYNVQIDGLLTIRDVSRPVRFDATVTPVSDAELQGTATTIIRYADWGINIPQVPLVASVDNDVLLQLSFVATA